MKVVQLFCGGLVGLVAFSSHSVADGSDDLMMAHIPWADLQKYGKPIPDGEDMHGILSAPLDVTGFFPQHGVVLEPGDLVVFCPETKVLYVRSSDESVSRIRNLCEARENRQALFAVEITVGGEDEEGAGGKVLLNAFTASGAQISLGSDADAPFTVVLSQVAQDEKSSYFLNLDGQVSLGGEVVPVKYRGPVEVSSRNRTVKVIDSDDGGRWIYVKFDPIAIGVDPVRDVLSSEATKQKGLAEIRAKLAGVKPRD